ncbi:MAG: alpha/beta hydrolase [Alphaproteobacteria bacterium]|nr:alpha/beta hydrolase [Alphaproteobacteria bacterium]
MTVPFRQLPWAQVPELPRRPHRFHTLEVRMVDTWTAALGDVPTAVRVVGQGPPLLLVHGLMTTSYSWRYVYEDLARDHTVYMPDIVGAGRTIAPERTLLPEHMADWLRALQESLGIFGCDVIGNSMGGYLAMWLALRHPGAVGRLVQLHGPAFAAPRLWALWVAIRLPFARAVLGALVRRDPLKWAHRNVHYWDETLKSREEAREYGLVLTTPEGLRGFHLQLRDMMDARGLVRFERLLRGRRDLGCDFPVPVQLLYARRDPMVPPSTGSRLGRLVRNAELTWIEQGSHFAHVDAPDAFLEAARRFLAR